MGLRRSSIIGSFLSLLVLPISGRFAPVAASESAVPGAVTVQAAARMAPPVSRLAQADGNLEKLERTVEGLVNAERAKAGLKPLTFEATLADVGRAHSAEMRDLNYFGHLSPISGLSYACDRYCAAYSTTPPVVAENIYRAWGGGPRQISEADVLQAHKSFMRSPTHRENILYPKLTHIGVGIVTNSNGDIWITQMFCRM
jgi:uncharacterized protein YkwD